MKLLTAVLVPALWAAPAKELTILLKMLPSQQVFFADRVLKPFEEKNGCKIRVETFADPWEIPEKLQALSPAVDVVKVPMGLGGVLAGKRLVLPLGKAAKPGLLKKIGEDYYLLNLGTFGDTLFYLPRKFETRIMAYRKSKVQQAADHWKDVEKDLNRLLREAGLPELGNAYTLEPDPSQWDYKDLLAAGFYWAKTSGGKGKIAHRGKRYGGTALDLIDRAFQQGASPGEALLITSAPFVETLRWESLFTQLGVYPKACRLEGWDGEALWKAFGRDELFVSFLTQIDCYFLHGTENPEMPGFLSAKGDLGFCPMPQAVGLDDGSVKSRATTTGGWFWGVGARSRDPQLAFELLQHITSYENQLAECDRFGMIPVRKDILGKAAPMFNESWKIDVFLASLGQLKLNGKASLPPAADVDRVERQALELWERVCAESEKRRVVPEEIRKWASEIQKTGDREARQERLPKAPTP